MTDMNELEYKSSILRPVRPEDAFAITEIYSHYVRHTTVTFEEQAPDVDEMRRRMDEISAICPFIVAESECSEILGYCYVHPWKKFSAYSGTFETTIYLRDGHTSHGLGRQLIHRLMDECRSRGYHALIACITAENEGSIRFHDSLGFVPVSHYREVGHKFGRYLDVVDMELLL